MTEDVVFPNSEQVDILLTLEGTFPFVIGGVSSWVNNLMLSLPQYQFGIIFLGGRKEDYPEMRYTLPKNLTHLEAHYLFDETPIENQEKVCPYSTATKMDDLHQKFKNINKLENICLKDELLSSLLSSDAIEMDTFLHSYFSWEFIVENYLKSCPQISFLDYFWTIRNLHLPIWKIAKVAKNAPRASVIHSVSTGYAGLLASILSYQYDTPFMLSEHGLYSRERKIDLLNQWIAVGGLHEQRQGETQQYLTNLWVHFFEVLSRISYQAATPIISLFKAYQEQQIKGGAAAERTMVIPNGITITELDMKSQASETKPIIGLIGRVVPIKDIKTFIRTMIVITKQIPEAQGWIIGPTDEDEEYFQECKALVNVLGLTENVLFLGWQKLSEVLPKLDLLMLTSISEGLPLVLLEGFNAGIPAVTTNVGACAELIYGKDEEDRKIGASGIVVETANVNLLAKAVLAIIENPNIWKRAQAAGRERVKRYYTHEEFLSRYQAIYERVITYGRDRIRAT